MTDLPLPWLSDPAGRRHPLQGARVSLGRAVDNDIMVAGQRASREHAVIGFDKHRVWVEDLGSANGTWLNGERISARTALKDGDRLTIGDVALIYHDPNATYRDPAQAEIELDAASGVVRIDQRVINLAPKEFALLGYLVERRGQVCAKADIARAVWPEYQGDAADYQIENLMRRLRARLEPDAESSVLIETVRGHGYRFIQPGM